MKPASSFFVLALALAVPAEAPLAEAARGRVVVETLRSRALRGNAIGDTADREVTIYLPPGYERDAARRYPVLYLLHGITSDPREWLDGTYQGLDLRESMDALAGDGRSEFLVVMPHADNRFGGSFYVNSEAFGRWEDFVARELVRFVDARYRTSAIARHRGLAGQSMGGFGALYLAGRHSKTFGHVYAMSPCCLGFVGELAPESDAWTRPPLDPARASSPVPGQPRWIRTMAVAFAPQAGRGGAAVSAPLPFAADGSGRPREVSPVARAWRKYLPLERLAQDARPYRRLISIAVDFGREDPIPSVPAGSRAFAGELQRAGASCTLEEYTGGHTDRTRERFETRLLPFFGRAFSGEEDRD